MAAAILFFSNILAEFVRSHVAATILFYSHIIAQFVRSHVAAAFLFVLLDKNTDEKKPCGHRHFV